MIKKIVLTKFKGFREHSVNLEKMSILVGQNNAGKTTIIEALRIASLAITRCQSARYELTPSWLADHSVGPGFYFSLSPIEFDKTFVHYNSHEDDPAQIEIRFASRHKLRVSMAKNERDAFCQLYRSGRYHVNSRSDAGKLNLQNISVMPPVGTLLLNEKSITEEHVDRNINGRLSHRHIRNQMAARPEDFEKFQQLLEQTWSGLKVSAPEFGYGEGQNEFQLYIREPAYTSELGRVGSGLQAWVQMLWFLCRTDVDHSVVLDEPDVFLHADIQRKLLKLLSNEKFRQTVVATHSVDIISDVSPESVIIVQKKADKSESATTLAPVQAAIKNIGTVHNILLSKIAAQGRFLFVEGEDVKFLSEIAYKLGPTRYDKFSRMACDDIGGAGNIQRAVGAADSFHKASGSAIESHLILDRDYKSSGELEAINKKVSGTALGITIWNKKELENFFLIEAAAFRIASEESDKTVSIERVIEIFELIENDLFQKAKLKRAQAYQEWKRGGCGLEKAIEEADRELNLVLGNGARKRDFCSGKAFISNLSASFKEEFGVQLNAMSLCRECKISELDEQIVSTVKSLA